MKTITTTTEKDKALRIRPGVTFRSVIAYIHSYFRFISELHSSTKELKPGDRFRVVRTKSDGCDTHVFTGDRYTILITVRVNEPEKGTDNN